MIIVPCYDLVIVPGVTYYFQQDVIQKIVLKEPQEGEEAVFLMLKEDKEREQMVPEDFYSIGVKGIVEGKNKEGNTGMKTLCRIQIDEVNIVDGEILVEYTEKADIQDEDEKKIKQELTQLKEELIQFVSGYPWGIMARNYILYWNSLEEMIASMSYQLKISNEEKYRIVEADKISERHERIIHAMYETLEVAQIGSEAQKAQTQSHEKIYREEAIKKQIQILQDELDKMHPENITDIRKFELEIQKSEMNETARTEAEKMQIAKNHLLPKAMENMGIAKEILQVSEEALHILITDYTMESGVRGLKKMIDTVCREAAVKIVEGEEKQLLVEENNIREFVDRKPIRHDRIKKASKAGIVTGLAWTQAGGDILFIETLLTEGKGDVIITGQLGDVMQESVQIAISLVKAMYPDKAEIFKTHDLHIHVPAGAVPKDGPSAGITLVTALASLVSEKPVSPEIAMTGEVSLSGDVMVIGGLSEKLGAAVRAGIKKVFIPNGNIDDLEDVAEDVKSKLKIIPVEVITDVLKYTKIME